MGRVLVFCVLALSVLICSALDNTKCRGLALEGGGDKGAYEVGVLRAFLNGLSPDEIAYDIVTGVSVGALNALHFAYNEKGKEQEAIDMMYRAWTEISSKQIYSDWFGGKVYGILFKPGIYNSKPLADLINNFGKDKTMKRPTVIGTTNADTAQFFVFDQTFPNEDFLQGVLASVSFPGVFPYVVYNGNTLIDGSCLYSVTIFDAINHCKKAGFAESDIIIDVVLTSGSSLKEKDVSDFNGLEMLIRYLEINSYYKVMGYIENAEQSYPDVNIRYLVFPTQDLPSALIPLDFNRDDVDKMIKQGEIDGAAAIQTGAVHSKQIALEYYRMLKSRSTNGKHYSDYFVERAEQLKEPTAEVE